MAISRKSSNSDHLIDFRLIFKQPCNDLKMSDSYRDVTIADEGLIRYDLPGMTSDSDFTSDIFNSFIYAVLFVRCEILEHFCFVYNLTL